MRSIEFIHEKKGEKILRHKSVPFIFEGKTQKEINDLVSEMRAIMHKANGIGLAANQIGLDFSVFVAEVPVRGGKSKFYAAFNPRLEKVGEDTGIVEEGCLSVPNTYGEVERAEKVTLSFQDKSGKPQKIKAWGLLARVFQHEMDHLDGKLIIDRSKKLIKLDDGEE